VVATVEEAVEEMEDDEVVEVEAVGDASPVD
jgi:hypothetical protein